jgi:peptidoglycan/xylan/chitin deacetylase (PgdA/CDA1 family)
VVLPYPSKPEPPQRTCAEAGREEEEIFGKALPPKTIVLTFDDGPHRRYSDEIAAILKQYNAPAIFFSVGRNLGSLDAQGKTTLNGGAQVSRRLKQAGYVLANHSFSHAQLSKQTGDGLKAEILNTDALLKAVDPERSPLFRFPYGARNREGMQMLENAHLKSVMWNIDSLDWADPVPSSIAERVLRTVDKEGTRHHPVPRHPRAHRQGAAGHPRPPDGRGLPVRGLGRTNLQDLGQAGAGGRRSRAGRHRLRQFVGDRGRHRQVPEMAAAAVRRARRGRRGPAAGRQKFGFAPERVLTLKNEQATRAGILAAFHDRLAHGKLQPNDRLFVFFAGHGATRKLSSGRDLGYIVPVDADPDKLATDAIPMTEIQNIAESLPAKHALFVMDACYSGLGLTRGAANGSFLRDNARRLGARC